MPDKPPLGKQELELLQFVARRAPISVSDAAKQFGEPMGLARTTILTVMERLRKKGYLTRDRTEGSYRYSPSVPHTELLGDLVKSFIEKTLGGSLSPFIAYLGEAKGISEEEIEALRKRVEEMAARQEER